MTVDRLAAVIGGAVALVPASPFILAAPGAIVGSSQNTFAALVTAGFPATEAYLLTVEHGMEAAEVLHWAYENANEH